MFTSLFRRLFPGSASRKTPYRKTPRKSAFRPSVETLEDRAVPAAVAPPSGMVAWWTADNSGVDLIGGNNASLFNGANYAAGKVGQAFNFDGVDDRAQVADTDAMKLTASMTIEAWVRVDTFTQNQGGIILFRGDDRGGLDPYALTVMSDGSARFLITTDTNQTATVSAPMPLGQLTHVAATLEDLTGSMKLYLNGVLATQTTTTIRPFRDLDPASNPSIGIGNHGGYPSSPHNFPLDGLIDELAVYNRALSAGEVQGIYSAGSDGKIRSGNYIAADFPSVTEGAAASTSIVTFTITRVGNLSGEATVNWSTSNGTATAGADYVADSGQVVFADGESQKTVQVTVNGDDTPESNETINLILSTTTPGYAVGMGQLTIIEDDVGVAISDASALEGDHAVHYRGAFVQNLPGTNFNGLTFGPDGMLYTSPGPNKIAPIDRYDGTTGAFIDHFVPAGRINGVREKVFQNGYLYIGSEYSDEVLRFNATTGVFDSAFVAANSSVLDGPHGLTFGPDTNGDNVAELYVSGRNSQNVVRYDGVTGMPLGALATSGSGALSLPEGISYRLGVIYVASTGTNQIQKYDALSGAYLGAISGSGLLGPKDVKFGSDGLMYVASSGNNRIMRFAATGTYVDDYVPAGSGGMANPYRIAFGPVDGDLYVTALGSAQILRFGAESEAVYTVSLSMPATVPVTVNYATEDGTAFAGSEYTATSGTITFAPGITSKTILVPTLDDRTPEASKTFTVTLSNPEGATISDGTGVATIADNEPRISISDVTLAEGRKGRTTVFTFTISLSNAYDQAVTMSYQTVNGTATTANKDYVAKSGTITFNPGETTKTITIVVTGDNTREADELFYVDLFGNSSNSQFTKNRGIGTILNDD